MALRPLNVLSLCAGVGGLELGISLALHHRGASARGICYVEREAAAAASLVTSMEQGWLHPAPVWSDLLTFDARAWRGLVHILASGDPCQDNSVAGQQAGADGERFLAPEVVRIADECRPDLIFRENVPGNASGQLAAIVPSLERLGYRVAAGIFSSAETGNSMRRERLFIMARTGCDEPGKGRRDAGEVRGVSVAQCWADDSTALFSGSGRQLARSPVERPGEARIDLRRSEERSRGSERALDGPERPEWRPISEPCGEGGGDALSRGEEGSAWAGASSGELASAGDPGSQGQQRGQHHAAGRQVKVGHAGLRGRAVLPPAVIPGPTDSRWIDVLDRWPELQPALSEEEAQSHLRRGVDAMAHRVERLRATGNGVDPLVAAYAFLSLSDLLAEARTTRRTLLTTADAWPSPARAAA